MLLVCLIPGGRYMNLPINKVWGRIFHPHTFLVDSQKTITGKNNFMRKSEAVLGKIFFHNNYTCLDNVVVTFRICYYVAI